MDLPHLGQRLLADTPQSRGTAAEGIRPASSSSSHVTHSSASLIQPSATALADGYFATFSRARVTASSVKSVRRSFSGYCGVRVIDGMVVAGRDDDACDDVGAGGAAMAA